MSSDSLLLSESGQQIFILATILYLELFWLPFLIFNLYTLTKYKDANEFKKRHPLYLFLLYFIILFHIGLQRPFCLLILFPSQSFFNHDNYSYSSITGGFINIFSFCVVLGFFLLFFARSWILYHDHRFNDSAANLCWRLEIQPNYKLDNWWIRKRAIYGNPKYILLLMMSLWLFLLICYSLIFIIANKEPMQQIVSWIIAVFAIIPIITFYAIVVIKIREITDIFKIKTELIDTYRIILLCVLTYFLLLIVCVATNESMESSPIICIQSIITCSAGGFIVYLNVKYIKESAQINIEHRNSVSSQHSVLREYNISDMNLEQILEDRTGYELFIKHLVQELSVENLLFITELQQFRQTLNCNDEYLKQSNANVPLLNLLWLPISVGLQNENAWLRAVYIYAKFICKTAMHQINISHKAFIEITAFFPELSGLNDTENLNALPTKGLAKNLYFDLPQIKKKQLMEQMKKSVDVKTNSINRRVEQRKFRALSEKYIKSEKMSKHKKNVTDVDEIEMKNQRMSDAEMVSFKSELFHIFDCAESEVWLLMNDSLTRFQQTSTYEKMAIKKALRKRRSTSDRLSIGSGHSRGLTSFWKKFSSATAPKNSNKKDDLNEPLLSDED